MRVGAQTLQAQTGRMNTKQNAMDRLLFRPAEVAEALGIGRSKAYELIASGVIPSIRIGSSVRVPLEALRAWMERQIADSASAANR